jgi:hypothetical protein
MRGTKYAAVALGMALAVLTRAELVEAKRKAPAPVAAIEHDGIRYVVAHFDATAESRERGGWIEAWDVAKGTRLWSRQVYRIRHDPHLEGNVQDVFITRIQVRDGALFVENELLERFEMELASGKVIARGKASGRTEIPNPDAPLVEGAGRVVRVGRFGYGIVPDADSGTRYAPEELPAELRVDGLRVVFAGVLVAPPAGVRQWGTPLRLTSIRKAPDQAP